MTAPKEMFLPGNRNEWTALVRPPEGYRLDSAIATTYCLDFTALTAILLATLDQQSNQSSWDDRAHLIQAITRAGDRVRVLVNRGQIKAQVRPSNKLFALFDEVVEEVHYPAGSFHPKVWVLKYIARRAVDTPTGAGEGVQNSQRGAVYRLICTSRNLTLASTWEAAVCLDGCIAETGDDSSMHMGRDVASFFETVRRGTQTPKAIQLLLKELKRVAFSLEGSKAVQSSDFLWQCPGSKPLEHLVPSGKTALMVTPFIGPSFLRALANRFQKVVVVSRQEELDACWPELRNVLRLENVWVVKANDVGESIAALDLHAKILLCEYAAGASARTEAWIGSANASARAWGLGTDASMNCEAMVRCRPAIRPEQFLEQFAYRDVAATLNGWIEQYQPQEVKPLTDEEEADKYLEKLQQEIASLELRARVERSNQSLSLTLYSPDRTSWRELLGRYPDTAFEACPMGISDSAKVADMGDIGGPGIRFDGLSIAHIGALVLIRLTDRETKCQKAFVVKATLENMDEAFMEERRVAFLKENLDAKAFRALLRCILFGEELRRDPLADPDSGDGKIKMTRSGRQDGSAQSLFEEFSVEDVLQSCTADSSRIDEIDRLVTMFAKTDHVDPSFVEFWQKFRAAILTTTKLSAR